MDTALAAVGQDAGHAPAEALAPYRSRPGALTERTLEKLATYFASRNHRPSDDQWDALADLAVTMEAMALGRAPARFYLSSLDPGVGKTRTLICFTDALLADREHEDVGVLICLGRLAEVRKLVHEAGIPDDMLAVVTSDEKLNALGKAAPDDARVLITTQQRVERLLSVASFADVPLFRFKGQLRQVRVWDETWLPGQTITLNRDELAILFAALRPAFPKLTSAIEDFFTATRSLPDGATVAVPNFAEEHDTDLNAILGLLDNPRDGADQNFKEAQRAAISALWFVAGRTCAIRQDGAYGNTLLEYRDTMPEALAPMVIMDASGRVRRTYRDVEEHRGTLTRLRTAAKDYGPLKVHVWQRGGGKRAFQRDGGTLAEGIAKTINERPTEAWLVVVHQPDARVGDVERAIREKLAPEAEGRVSFLSWGQHMATNDFADVPNVVLAGTLFYRPSYYDALKRLACNRRATEGDVTAAERWEVFEGENAHLVLQAACRGAVRKSDGHRCPPTNLYIIASVRSGIPGSLKAIFPGCTVSRWQPVDRPLTGKVGEAVAFLREWAGREEQDYIAFADLQRRLRMDRSNFKRAVRSHPDFQDAIAELGLVEWGRGKLFTGLLRFGPGEGGQST